MSSDTRERSSDGTGEWHDPQETPVSIVTYVSELDGATVVEVETGPHTGRLRVYVGEGVVFDQKAEEPGPHGTCGYVWRENDVSPPVEGHHRCTLRSGHGSQRHYCSSCGAETAV
jgi:hypothetical protein